MARTPKTLCNWACNRVELSQAGLPGRTAGLLAVAVVAALAIFLTTGPVRAQRLVATVNDAPITNYDIGQRQRLLRALRKKTSATAALESLIEDRLKASEAKKYNIKANDQQILQYAASDAQKRKIAPNQLAHSLQRGGIDEIHWKDYYRSQLAWDTLIAALYKAVSVSPREVDQELARRGRTTNRTEYRLRQIVLVVPRTAGGGAFQARLREANGLRSRFTNCTSGIKLARSLRDVAVQAPVTRRAVDLSPQLIKLFDSTPVGKLTAPSRGATGIELIAVCGKSDLSGQIAAGNTIEQEILSKKLEVHSNRRYQDLRRRAIIIRR